MKNLAYYLSIILGFAMLVSCDPTTSYDGDHLLGISYTPGTVVTTRQLRSMETHLEDNDGNIETKRYIYTYSNGNLVSYQDENGETTTFAYDKDKKISKVSNAGQSSVFDYTGGVVSKITTTLTNVGTITSDYTYTSGKLVKVVTVQDLLLPMPVKTYVETNYQYQGDNVSTADIKNGVYNPVTGDLEMSSDSQTIAFTYDAKPSPYKLLPQEYILLLAGLGPQGGAYLSANNFENVSITDSDGQRNMTFTYVYDKKDYPVTSTSGNEYIKYSY